MGTFSKGNFLRGKKWTFFITLRKQKERKRELGHLNGFSSNGSKSLCGKFGENWKMKKMKKMRSSKGKVFVKWYNVTLYHFTNNFPLLNNHFFHFFFLHHFGRKVEPEWWKWAKGGWITKLSQFWWGVVSDF